MLPRLGSCKQGCSDQQAARVLSSPHFPWIYAPGVELQDCMVILLLVFKGASVLFLEKAMAIRSRVLARRILWTEEPVPGGLRSMGRRVGHD